MCERDEQGKPAAEVDDGAIEVPLRYRPPMETEAVIAYLARRAVPGVEEILEGAYRRSVRLPGGPGVVEIAAAGARIRARYWLRDGADLETALQRCRVLLDLDRDPGTVLRALGDAPVIGALVRETPGLRVPGHVDGDEIAVRAVLGQQVSLAGAATLAGRLVRDYGEPLEDPVGGVTHLFPTAAALVKVEPERLPMPTSRRRALVALAGALANGRIVIDAGVDHARVREHLLELPGIGPWTADYIALRALRDPDAFLASDLGVRRALEALGYDGSPSSATRIAESWRPYRAYALMHLWASLKAGGRHRNVSVAPMGR
jgi:AraC family transcriptional regulator, regulatory protein of adaptative response / DNA-3-methyladenine glycosylase II